MLPREDFELAREIERMYRDAGENCEPVDAEWMRDLGREIALRRDDLIRYDLPGEALVWNFETMLYLVRWTWRTLEPFPSRPADLEFAPWDKPANELSQTEFNDSLRALAVRWRTLRPGKNLWKWLDQLDRRAADLCVNADVADALDEDCEERDGVRCASDEFVNDVAAALAEMNRDREVHRDFLATVGRVYRPRRLPHAAEASAWFGREFDRLTSAARETMDHELSSDSVRPGETSRYARAHLGVVPEDLRVIIRHCRPQLSDYRADRPTLAYNLFDRACKRHAFDWADLAYVTEREYFREISPNLRYCDVMFGLDTPTVFRLMGSDYVYGGCARGSTVWRCANPPEAICLWISLAPSIFRAHDSYWDLSFLGDLEDEWKKIAVNHENKLVVM